MRIAFISANRENMPDEVVPLGILYVLAATPEHHERELWDLCFEEEPLTYLAARITAFQPDLLAIGLRNIQSADYTGKGDNLRYYESLMATLRAHTEAPVVLGGSGFSVMPAEIMQRLCPDYGIEGEGEAAFPKLVEALAAGDPAALDAVAGLHRFEGGELLSVPRKAVFLHLDDLAPADRDRVDRRYYEGAGIEAIQTKRGCALKCDYCTYPSIEGRFTRARTPSLVVDELIALRDGNPLLRHFFIVDSVFNIPPRHAKAVCREMIARGFRTPWTCYANPLGFDDELASLMAAAGCAGMEIGSDSGCDDVLLRLRKGFTTDHIRSVRCLSQAHGLRDCHTFLLGTPDETMDHVRRSLDFIVDLDPHSAIIMAWKDDYESLDADYGRERRRLREHVLEVLREKQHEFPRWIIPSLGVNFRRPMFDALRRKGLTGPLWQYIRLVDRTGGCRRHSGPTPGASSPT